jgi:hypothetical protein
MLYALKRYTDQTYSHKSCKTKANLILRILFKLSHKTIHRSPPLFYKHCSTNHKEKGLETKIKDLCTSDKNASSDSPPNAFLSTASLYGYSIQGLQLKVTKYQITLPRVLVDIRTRERHTYKKCRSLTL